MIRDMRRLHPRGAAGQGICVDAEGAMLGPDCTLVGRTSHGYRAIDRGEAAGLQKCLFDIADDQDWLYRQCQRIAKALNKGEIALAQIYGLRIPLDGLDASQLTHAALAKTGFNPDEPRIPKGDPHGGEWTTGAGPTEVPASTNLLADRIDNEDNGSGIKWEMRPFPPVPPSASSTLDSPDLTNGAPDADYGGGRDYGGGADETLDNDAIYPDYTFENLLFLLGTRGLSGAARGLARALIRAGISRSTNSDTHHIVARAMLAGLNQPKRY
jgi:hypothetical protein